jgi:4-amino-4-deoxy-L-arabinose transferase-like glycosyltransferase
MSSRKPLMSWATWPMAVALIVVIFIVRLIYLIWLSPYELAGDEAYYWECSRHLSLCYYEKGPGLAWVLAACCHLFGESEWAIRLPTALSFAGAAWVVGRIALRIARGDQRVAFLAVLLFCFIPAFQANAQICTQDGPMMLLWALLTASGLRLVERWESGRLKLHDWLLPAFLLGVSFLFKQSALLFLLGGAIYLMLRRRQLNWNRRQVGHLAVASLIFLATINPMIIWNQQHGWPTLTHTLGHLGAPGGDHDADKDHITLLSPLSLIGAQLGAVGIPALLIMFLACAWAIRTRRDEPDRWPARLWLICCSVPAVLFFVALSFVKPVIGGWPFPSYVPLLPLCAEIAVREFERQRGQRRRLLTESYKIALGYGAAGWFILCFPNLLCRLPVVGASFERSVMRRIAGHQRDAQGLDAIIVSNVDSQGRPPIIITRYYQDAALDAYYLPGRPKVYNAGTLTGQRMTSYDFWPDLSLTSPQLLGRTAVLDGGSPTRPWPLVLRFDRIRPIEGTRRFVGVSFGGVGESAGGAAGGGPVALRKR